MDGPAWWRFLPPGSAETGDLLVSAMAGQGALSRRMRELRAEAGVSRVLARFAALGPEWRGRPFRLLLVTAQQPKALAEALRTGFAIAGFDLSIHAVEGLPELMQVLGDPASLAFEGIDLTLLSLDRRSDEAGDGSMLAAAARRISERTLSPVAIGRFAASATSGEPAPGVFDLCIAAPDEGVFDERFGASFGSILTVEAADRLGDAAAGLAARLAGTAPKLVVTDLDGTLWTGLLGEGDGACSLHWAYADALAVLASRGLILAVATRNDPGDVAGALSRLPLDVSATAAGWADKAALVADILAELGIAAEHTVFIDDDAVNCAKVAARFPAMDVRRFCGAPEAFAATLLDDPLLANVSAGGPAARGAAYRMKAEVERLRAATPDIAAFLAELGTTITVLPVMGERMARAAELGARVNQFVFNDYRPNRLQLAARASSLDRLFRLDDAFGSHGLVGLVLASLDEDCLIIDNLMLSCRALERGVEAAMLHVVAGLAQDCGRSRIRARIETLPRNAPARSCLPSLGFCHDGTLWHMDLDDRPSRPSPAGVTIRYEDLQAGPPEGRST